MNKLLMLMIALLYANQSWGQDKTWTYGLKANAGLNGVGKTEWIDATIRDEVKRGKSYGLGIHGGYSFSKYFTATVDVEWQHFGDQRERIMEFTSVNAGYFSNRTKFNNKFQRILVPIALQFSPFQHKLKPYLKVGIAPSYILNGSFDHIFTGSQTDRADVTKVNADFELPPNQKLQKQMDFPAGIGIRAGQHWSVEMVHYFAGRLDYASAYTPQLFVLHPTYFTYALRNTQVSVRYHIR